MFYIVAWDYSSDWWLRHTGSAVKRRGWRAYHKLERATDHYNRLAGRTRYRALTIGFGHVLAEVGKLRGYRW